MPKTSDADSNLVDYLLLGALALIWSTSFLLIKIGLSSIPPYTLTAARLTIAALLLGIGLKLTGKSLPIHRDALQIYLFVGIFGSALPFSLISVGEVYIDSAMAAILMGIMPISTFVFAHLLIPSEPMTRRKLFGVSLGFFGLITLVGLSALRGIGGHAGSQLLVLCGALSYSASAIYVRIRPGFGGLQMALGATIVAAMAAVATAFLFEQPLAIRPQNEAILAAILLGIFPTAVASLLYFRVIRNLGAVTFSQINYLVPVLGSIWGVLLLGEQIGYRAVFALGLVLTGVYFIQPRRHKPALTPPPKVRP